MTAPERSAQARSGGASAPVEPASSSTAAAVDGDHPPGLRQFKRRRMPDFDYAGRYAYHLVTVTTNREPLLVDGTARDVASVLTESSAATKFDLLAYVVMPDHVHVLALGVADDANVIGFMQRFKQVTGFRYKQRCAGALWQHSFYDRALRRDEDLMGAARYILGNPVRAGLMTADDVWPHQGGALLAGTEAGWSEGRISSRPATGAEAPPLRVQDDAPAQAPEEMSP